MELKLISLFGMAVFVAVAWACSLNRKLFPWRTVLWGLALQFFFALQRGNRNAVTQRRLPHGDGHDAVQVLIVALEDGMLTDAQDDVKIAGSAAAGSGFAFSLDSQPRSIVDPGRHVHFQDLFLPDASLATTLRAVRGDHATGASASRARARDAEESLLVS